MYITYPVHTVLQTEAIRVAKQMAQASGYHSYTVVDVQQTGSSSWDVTLVVFGG